MIPTSFLGFADPVSSWSHLLSASVALIGTGVFVAKGRGSALRVFALMVFSFALVFLFSMSGVFHLLERGGDARDVLRRLDHAGIWTLIAATFVPIHVILFRGHRRWTILAAVWIAAITGMVIEMVFFDDVPEFILLSLFLGLGWVGALSGYHFRRSYGDPSLRRLALGGLAYSIGALIDFLNWPVLIPGVLGPHEIFHFFIIAGAAYHWAFVFKWCDHPIADQLTFEVMISKDHVIARAVGERMEIEARSVEEAKEMIRAVVANRYHSTIKPSINLRYFNEEKLS
ncbi:MAG: hemolysin III family protein [Bdellovibrionota bacterium]